jgi:hypothetical protein
MARDWEQQFRTWSKPSSDTEAEKQENAEKKICEAIAEYEPLKEHKPRIIVQGSYRNNTNIRLQSDVDICVCCTDPFYDDYTHADYTRADAGLVASPYSYDQFKDDVYAALKKKFGEAAIRKGKKAFDVHPTTSRVDADVVPAFAYRMYLKKASNWYNAISYCEPVGTKFYSEGKEIINFPDQQHKNGVAKNVATGYRFKLIVRAMKNLQCEMAEKNIEAAKPIPSFLVECLSYRATNACFEGDSYKQNIRDVITEIFNATKADENCNEWCEVNDIKYLFRPTQPWTRQQVNDFMLAAWRYCEFQ